MSLILVRRDDVAVGKPLPWPLYDSEHKALAEQGQVIRDQEHLASLLATGAYRELSWEVPVTKSENGDPPADPVCQGQIRENKPRQQFDFEDMKLEVGSRLQLEPPKQLGRERFMVKVVGYVKGMSLIVTTPAAANGTFLQLLEGEKVVMRSFSGQNIFAFACTVVLACKRPYEYLHLSFPGVIQGVMIRKAPRVRTRIAAAVQNMTSHNTGGRGSALISNISADGAALDAEHPLGNKGDILNLVFQVSLHKIDALLSVSGVIRTSASAEDTDIPGLQTTRYGIEFQSLQPNDVIILQGMVYQQIVEYPNQMV